MILDAIGIIAKDLNKTIKFYRTLGVSFPDATIDIPHVEATLPSGLRLMLDSEELMKKLRPDWVTPEGQRITLAFLCTSSKDVDESYQRVIDSGFTGHTPPWDAPWGQRYASVADPDGNIVDLFASL